MSEFNEFHSESEGTVVPEFGVQDTSYCVPLESGDEYVRYSDGVTRVYFDGIDVELP